MNNTLFKMNYTIRSTYRYAVYEHKLITTNGLVFPRSLIVIKNRYGVIVCFTGLHKYISKVYRGNNICQPMAADNKAKMHYICSMLNYILVDNYSKFKVNHIFSMSKSILDAYIQGFALAKMSNGKYRGRQSVEKCVYAVTEFFSNLIKKFDGYTLLCKEDLYNEKNIFNNRGKIEKKQFPDFQVRIMPEHKTIFRDIPTKVFEILLNQAFVHAKDIAFAICLQAFAGLRPGEALNVRQDHSPLGCGITITTSEEKIRKAEIDLTVEYILRSDGVVCGRIKKERIQRVHPAFLKPFKVAYKLHNEFLNTRNYESEYCPMFVNNLNMAMTYDDYYNRFKKLITQHLRPLLLNHKNAECRLYGQLLYENSLGLHSLRHWFSVQLVLMGEDIAQIQYWRGDSNPESALYYLQNKGDLIKELSFTNERLAEFMMNGGHINE